jgi:glyoxylase-like metal-dependent hydrolase (beta-lactamase superfamily II)
MPGSIHILDTRQLGRPGIIAAIAMETDEGLALFDTGPESTFENVVGELAKHGFVPGDVRHVFLSHIHFDHAGAAWRFAESGATIYVHARGGPHLIDPAKLVESATRIFGAEMERLWGRIAPVPAERVRILQDSDVVRLGALAIRAIETPGHASHHHVYHWDETVFGGDVAGVRIGSGPPIPPFVPPELQVESWRESIGKIRALRPAHLYLPHFGKVEGSVEQHLDEVDERVVRWSEWFRGKIRDGVSEPELREEFAALEHAELVENRDAEERRADLVADYEAADPSYMAVAGALRYWRKYHPEAINWVAFDK